MDTKESKRKKKSNSEHYTHPNIYMGSDPYKEQYRHSDITIRITSFGNAKQHSDTVRKALAELELRGVVHSVLDK